MATIVEEYGIRAVQPMTPSGLTKWNVDGVSVDSSELIGIEVEVENVSARNSSLNKAWQVTSDGSLRNNGVEIITRPIPASYAPSMLNYLFNDYLSNECCFGPRTSIHVHLNVQDLTRPQAMDLILMYSVYERLFYKFAGRGRQKNVYCVPLSDCNMLVNLIDHGETRDRQWSKYTGLNTLPISEYGTIEFRHMHGTTDVAKLSTWINLICKLKEFIRRTPTKQVRTLIAEMNDNFDFGRLMHDIFGVHAGALMYEGPQELNYVQAKQALTPRANMLNIVRNLRSDSAFFSFKGK